jgi:hypothetical protein
MVYFYLLIAMSFFSVLFLILEFFKPEPKEEDMVFYIICIGIDFILWFIFVILL